MAITVNKLKLIVGLGNPGEKFKNTRHNVGFMVVDDFAEKNNLPDFKFSKKFNSLISEGALNNDKMLLVKPQTFMNNSGETVKDLLKNFPIKPGAEKRDRVFQRQVFINELLVVHDDIDLPLGKIKIVKNRGPAGHKGVESIIKEIKTKNFVRFRIGIKPPNYKPKSPEVFVLQNFSVKEKNVLTEIIKNTIKTIEMVLEEGIEKAMCEFNV